MTAAFGVEGFTDDHLALIKALGVERVIIAFDRDAAGDAGAAKLAERLMAEGFGCYRLKLPHGLDANEYALKVTPASKSLGALIRAAEWLGNGKAPERAASPDLAAVVKPAPSLAAKEAVEAASEKLHPVSSLPAAVEPAAPALEIACEVSEAEIVFALGAVRYRVRGFDAKAAGVLKVNVLASSGEWFHVDTLDLYHAKARTNYIARVAAELRVKEETVKADLGRVLLKLELLQAQADAPASSQDMSEADRRAALELLNAPDLLGRIVADFAACGVVGEETNKLVGYLAAVSRKLDTPLAVVIQSSSAAGKSSLMDAVLAFVPEEERIKYSEMTGQSLFYMGETNLKHKVLAICEEEGASRAAYALKLLQSDGELTIASTGKDAETGNLVTQEYRVEGPVSVMLIYVRLYVEWLEATGRTEQTVKGRAVRLERFVGWCEVRGLSQPEEITRAVLEAYQRYLYLYRKKDGKPLSIRTQETMLTPLRGWCKWLARERYVQYNAASELVLPRAPKLLPRVVLSVVQVERLMAQPDVSGNTGARDRAMLEVLYSTGMRRMELMNLTVSEIDLEGRTVMIRQGKGRRDRYIPMGERACYWVQRYLDEVRPHLVVREAWTLFLTDYGEAYSGNRLTDLVKRYMELAGIGNGACHALRHACATHMLENGADVRFIQALLGHADLSSTQIYTQVAIGKLKEIHAATHPAKLTASLLAAIDAEADEDAQ